MASPYGHALVGLGLFNLCYPRRDASRAKVFLLYGVVILGACSPDLDFLPGIFLGNPGRFHHGLFHSLGMALALSLTFGFLIAFFGKPYSMAKTTALVFVLVISHLALDFFTEDLKPPFGFPLFWPLSETYYISSWWILPHVERNFSNPTIWTQTLKVFLAESLFFLPFFFFSRRLRGDGTKEPPK
jgi:inner membrane protein